MGRFVTFGEVMFRFNPEGYLRIVQATKFEASLAGGEANVAVSLANYDLDTAFVTKVPAHEVGNCVVNEMRRYGVDTRFIVRGGKRLGIFYGITAQLCLRPSPNLLPHPCSYKRGKYIQYSRPFITFV